MGVELGPDEVAYRCNLVTLSDDDPPVMVDFAAGHPIERAEPPDRRRARRRARQRPRRRALPSRRRVPPSVRRAAATGPTPSARRRTISPACRRCSRPARRAPKVHALMDASRAVVRDAAREVGSSATQIWLWGQGVKPALPRSTRRTASPAACRRRSISCRVSACSPVSKWSTCRARPRASTTTTPRRRARACDSLADRDLFVLHIEATDEAGHQGLADVKVDALERWDADVIGPIVDALDARSRAVPDPAAARSRDAVHDQDAHVGLGAVPAVRLDARRGAAACTPSPRPRERARSPAHTLMGRLLAPA